MSLALFARPRCLSIVGALALVLASTNAFADGAATANPPDKVHAKEAYDRGLEAHKRGDLQKAAEEFSRADALAPSNVALQAALDAAIEADDAALGSELLDRSKREPAPPPALASSITAAHMKFTGRAGRLRVVCPPKATCLAKLDDKPMEVDKVVWARTGQRTVIVQVDGDAHTKLVDLGPDQVVDIAASTKGGAAPVVRPAPPPVDDNSSSSSASSSPNDPPPKDKRGILEKGFPPIIFYAGVGATVILGGASIALAVITSGDHSKFNDAGCATANFATCNSLKTDGQGTELATNIVLVTTGVAAIGTTLIGLFLTNWKGPLIAVTPGGGEAVWHASF